MTRKVWFLLVDEDGRMPRDNMTMYVELTDENDINDFRQEVKKTNINLLSTYDEAQLRVYASRIGFDAKNQHELEPSSRLAGLGVSEFKAVIVAVPSSVEKSSPCGVKRKFTIDDEQDDDNDDESDDEGVSLANIWQYWEMDTTSLPPPSDLATILQRKLPFRMPMDDVESIFDQDGPPLQCLDLVALISGILMEYEAPLTSFESGNKWLSIYNMLLRFPYHLCRVKGFLMTIIKNKSDYICDTTDMMRPDVVVHYRGLVLLRGEERRPGTNINMACNDLTKKMHQWNPIFYGDLPYILGYCTSENTLRIVTIDRSLQARTILQFDNIYAHKAEVIKTFFNLAFVLVKIASEFQRTCTIPMFPFTPDESSKRKIELMEDTIKRKIYLKGCRDKADFARIVGIYKRLQELNN